MKPPRPKPTEVGAPARKRSASRTPYNPGLQQLIQGKQTWAVPLEECTRQQGFLGWHQRGYLPHRDAPGLTQFVTCRLCDGFPASRRAEWEALLQIEDNRDRRIKLENYLDRSHGACWLRRPDIASLTETVLRQFHGRACDFLAWVVMPNHVHVLVQVRDTPLSSLIKAWKGRVAREANRLLGREGAFWERDYWDTYMRDEDHSARARRYTEQNPVRAGLVRVAQDWPYTSARFRDAHGRLLLPSPERRL